jgi:hypothetical protein
MEMNGTLNRGACKALLATALAVSLAFVVPASTAWADDGADTTPPKVVFVSPWGTGVPNIGIIVITFDEPIDPASGAAITLVIPPASTTHLPGTWTSETTYEAPYSLLARVQRFQVVITGFKDLAGNEMLADDKHWFTTADPALNNDATIASIAGQTITITSGSGLLFSDPALASITVPAATSVIYPADVVLSDSKATMIGERFYSRTFMADLLQINLIAGRTSEFGVMVDAENTSSMAYLISVTREAYPVTRHFGTWEGLGTARGEVDADDAKFVRLLCDGVEVPASNYTHAAGSTLLTLTEAHLKALGEGTYTYTAEYVDGTSKPITLSINLPDDSGNPDTDAQPKSNTLPPTGDNAPQAIALICLLLTLGGVTLRQTRAHKA